MPRWLLWMSTGIGICLSGMVLFLAFSGKPGRDEYVAIPMESDSAMVVASGPSGKIPVELQLWVQKQLELNDLSSREAEFFEYLSHDGHRIRNLDGNWVIDLEGLPFATIADPDPDVDVGNWRILAKGTSLCSEEDGERIYSIGEKLESHVEGKDEMPCSDEARRESVRKWVEGEVSSHGAKAEFRTIDGNRYGLALTCGPHDTLVGLGVLRLDPPLSLEVDGCYIKPSEQMELAQLDVPRLFLRDLRNSSLDLAQASMDRIDTLVVEGGAPTWFGPPDRANAPKPGSFFVVRKVPICNPTHLRDLANLGVRPEETRCSDYPGEMVQTAMHLDSAWNAMGNSTRQPSKRNLELSALPRMLVPHDTSVREVESPSPGGCSRDWKDPNATTLRWRSIGRNWMLPGPSIGEAIRGITPAGAKIQGGMSRQDLIGILGAPSLDQGAFLAWSVRFNPVQEYVLRAHFDDQGHLDAWINLMDPECDEDAG